MAKDNYRLLAIDLDGTLLDSQHRVPERNRAALHRAHEAGLKVVLCTGRSFTETRPVLAEIGLDLDATVCAFGALVSDARSGRTLARTAFDGTTAREITQWLAARDYAVLWLTDPDEVGFDGYIFEGARRHAGVDRWMELSGCSVRVTQRVPPQAPAPVRISIIDDPDALGTLADDLARAFDGRLVYNLLRAPAYSLVVIEMFAPRVSKWTGIRTLCERWQIDPAHTVAVGDDVNDVHMVASAGLGVAMGNAIPAVVQVARRRTGTQDECGVAQLIEELLAEREAARC